MTPEEQEDRPLPHLPLGEPREYEIGPLSAALLVLAAAAFVIGGWEAIRQYRAAPAPAIAESGVTVQDVVTFERLQRAITIEPREDRIRVDLDQLKADDEVCLGNECHVPQYWEAVWRNSNRTQNVRR